MKCNFIVLVGLHFPPTAESTANRLRCIASVKSPLNFEDVV